MKKKKLTKKSLTKTKKKTLRNNLPHLESVKVLVLNRLPNLMKITGKGKTHESVEAIQSELNEYKEAVVFLKDKLHEVNILNVKLLYTNKLFKEYV